jgi:hypothetical protein
MRARGQRAAFCLGEGAMVCFGDGVFMVWITLVALYIGGLREGNT